MHLWELEASVAAMSIQNIKNSLRGSTVALATLSLALAFATSACKKDDGTQTKKEETPVKKEETPVKKEETPKPGNETPASGENSLAKAAGDYTVDVQHSSVVFRAKHVSASYTYGMFRHVEGTIKVDGDPAKSEVAIKIDASKIYTGAQDRDSHLTGPDFLNATQFPEITFKSTAIKPAGDNHYEVTGDMTMRGVTKSVTGKFEHVGFAPNPRGGFLTGFDGMISIKLSDFEVKHKLIGTAVSDQIDLMIAVEALRK